MTVGEQVFHEGNRGAEPLDVSPGMRRKERPHLIQLHVLTQYGLHLCKDGSVPTVSTLNVHSADSWRARYWHRWALATNNLDDGVRRLPRDRALAHRYIETGPGAMTICVVIDVDHPNAVLRAFEKPSDHPKPSWVAEGPTGHAHVGWWLTEPVTRTDAGRQAPIRYLARTAEGLRRSLDGDPAYTSLLTRCPVAPGAEVIWGTDRSYSLRELGTIHTPRQLPRKPERSHGFGRNCTMFDTARQNVYGLHDPDQPFAEWQRLVMQHCHAANSEFPEPLPFSEVTASARSISKWVRDTFVSKKEWHRRQGKVGGQRSGANRRAARDARIQEVFG